MFLKRFFPLLISVTLMISILFGSVASAADYSEEKLNLMIAAGEITADAQVDDSGVKIKKDEAVKIARTMLEDPESYQVGGTYLNPRWGSSNSTWNIDFYSTTPARGSANVSIDAETGEIIGFNAWDYYDGQRNFVAKLTRTEARKLAEEFITGKLNLDMNSYELQEENPYNYGYRMGGVKEQVIYNFNYIKKINGIELMNNTLSIGVDGTDGKVRNFYINKIDVDTAKLPSSEGILTKEEAMEKYKDSVNVALQYVTRYEDAYYGGLSKTSVMLAYVPSTYINMIDAVTGKAINYDGTEIDMSGAEFRELAENPVPMNPEAALTEKAVSEEEAKASAEEYKEVMVEEFLDIKFEDNSNQYYYNGQDDVWNYNWNYYNGNVNAHFNISINAETGHILNLGLGKYDNKYDIQVMEGEKPEAIEEKVTWQEGRDAALELVKKLAPDQYGFFADQNIKEPSFSEEAKKTMREYNYNFIRVVNGIKFRDNNMNVSIDRETGELRNFYFNWSDMDFPDIEDTIDREKAAELYFDGCDAKLAYHFKYSYDNMTGQQIFADAPTLVYTFNSANIYYGSVIVDAVKGELVDWSGREIRLEEASQEPELTEHWAKRSVELLIAQGILKNPYVEYEEGVTRVEAVKMLALSKGMYGYYEMAYQNTELSFKDVPKEDEYYTFVESAVRQKILDAAGEFKGSEVITKEEFVVLLVKMLGYGDIAKHSEIFKVSGINNISEDLTGYIAVCSVLDILPIKEGEVFDGKSKVNYAEAASALYKALSYIK